MRQRQCAREFRRDRQNVRGLCEGTEGYCGGTALWGLKGTERYSTRGFGRGRQGVRDRGNDLRRGARWPDRTQQLTPGIQRTHVMQCATDRGHTTRTCPRPHNTPRRVACRTLLVACRNLLVASLIIRHAFSMSLLTWLQAPREPHIRALFRVVCCLLRQLLTRSALDALLPHMRAARFPVLQSVGTFSWGCVHRISSCSSETVIAIIGKWEERYRYP